MNFSLLNVVLFGAGALLITASIKDRNPKDIITDAFDPKKRKLSETATGKNQFLESEGAEPNDTYNDLVEQGYIDPYQKSASV